MKFKIDGLLMTVLDIFSVCAINALFRIGETFFLKHAHEHLFMIMFIVKNWNKWHCIALEINLQDIISSKSLNYFFFIHRGIIS